MGSLTFDNDHENNSHFVTNLLDPKEFRRQGHMIIDYIADYYENIERNQILSQVEPNYLRKLLPESAPYSPEPLKPSSKMCRNINPLTRNRFLVKEVMYS